MIEHIAGYRFAGGNADDLTPNQELFVALVAEEQTMFQARLAGADVKERPRKARKGQDPYGDILERRERMKRMDEEFGKNPDKFLNKPL